MEQLSYLNEQGDFILRQAHKYPGIYMPLVNEGGLVSAVTPWLAGDCKADQNTFLLPPAGMETLHESRAVRNFWIRPEGDAPWSVTGQSALQRAKQYTDEEETVLTGGLLWQCLTRRNDRIGLKAETLSFVPAGREKIEIMQVALTNCGEGDLTFEPIAAIPMYGRSADNVRDHRHVTSLLHRAEVEKYGVKVSPTMTFDERGHKPGRVTYRVWGAEGNGIPPKEFLTRTCDFVGQGSYDWPEALAAPGPAPVRQQAGDRTEGGEMTAVLFFDRVCLKPGETRRYQIALAIDEEPLAYMNEAKIASSLEETKAYWQKRGARFKTGDSRFDLWSRYVAVQPTLRRICGCSFLPHHDYGRGGRGWRDLWQDSLALILADPDAVRRNLLCYFAGVRRDGTNATIIGAEPGEFKADRNQIPRVWMDHGFWPLFTVKLYLDETGDDDFLLERQPYFTDTFAWRGEGEPRRTAAPVSVGTVLEHMIVQAVTAFFDVGEHGHIRLRGADWNDGLDMAKERGESVAFTAAYAYGLMILAQMAERLKKRRIVHVSVQEPLAQLLRAAAGMYGDRDRMRAALFTYCGETEKNRKTEEFPTEELQQITAAMAGQIRDHIAKTEWVGDGAELSWYNSYYDNNGRSLEGVKAGQVRMILTGQVFCLLSGTADEVRARQIIRAVDWYLCTPNRGGYCLNTDFKETKLDMGRMFGFAYGHKENGAVFCHMAVMYAYALYERGFAAEGWRVLELLYEQAADFGRSRILPGIPEYFDDRGVGMYPWLTGAGSWLMLTMQTQVFGVRGSGGNLCLEPKLTPAQFDASGKSEIRCAFMGRPIRVRYENPHKLDWQQYQIESIRIREKTFLCNTPQFVIPGEELQKGDGELLIEVRLAQKGGTENV
ncbi:MAG: cellobiose phosphorylase [Lachnospiraceae bacterium]|nr:cellobiose phosphorylase [Lachnospiraceae bacterium]